MNFLLLCIIFITIFINTGSFNVIHKASVIASSEFKFRTTTSVVWWEAEADEVALFLEKYQGCVETVYMSGNFNRTIALQQAVLFVSSSDDFLHIVTNLNKNITSPSKVVTVLINRCDLNNVTKIAWKYHISDLIILIPGTNQSVETYTFYPYSNDECDNTTPLEVDLKGNYFPRKFKNLLGCQTRLGSFGGYPYGEYDCVNGTSPYFRGLAGDMFMMIANHMNTTIKVLCLPSDQILSIAEYKVHVYTPTLLMPNLSLSAQDTGVYHFQELVWCGPPQREIYVWAKVLLPFLSKITIVLFATFLALTFLMKIINEVEPSGQKKSITHFAWNTLAIILGQHADYQSKSWLIHFLIVLWLWSSMVINISYQGLLVEGLQRKNLEPLFDTIENAVNLVDGYGGLFWHRPIYESTPIWEKFEEKYNLSDLPKYLTAIAKGKRYLFLTVRYSALGYSTNLQILKQTVTNRPMTTLIAPRWGGALEIKSAQTRLVEAGIFHKLCHDLELKIKKKDAKMNNDSSSIKAGHLDFLTLCTCFYGLGCMWLVCIFILLLEIVHYFFEAPVYAHADTSNRSVFAQAVSRKQTKHDDVDVNRRFDATGPK